MKRLMIILAFFPLVLSTKAFSQESAVPSEEKTVRQELEAPPEEKTPLETFELFMTKGITLFNQEKYQEAKTDFQTAGLLRPEDSEFLYFMGVIEAKLKQYNEAKKYLSRALEQGYQEAAFDLGVVFYLDLEYEQALTAFEKAPKNPSTPLYQGYVYEAMGKDKEAIAPFLRAASDDRHPAIAAEARYRIGLIYFKLNALEDAQPEFTEVVAFDPASPIGQSASDYLKRIDRVLAKDKGLQIFGSVGIQYDDNVLLESSDGSLGVSRAADSRVLVYLHANYPFESFVNKSGVAYSIYQNLYATLTQFNTQSHELDFYIRYEKDRLTGQVDYFAQWVRVDNEDYLYGQSLRPEATFAHGKNKEIIVAYQFQQEDFKNSRQIPANSNRDGITHAISLIEQVNLPNARLRAGIVSDTKKAHGFDSESVGHRLLTGARFLIGSSLQGEISFDYTERRYDHPIIDKHREDKIYMANAGVSSSKLIPRTDVLLQYIYTRNDSNVLDFDYKRGILSAYFTYKF